MKYTKVVFEQEARDLLFNGAKKLAKAVVSTLGPRSKNVVINQEYPAPFIVHDGVTVARSIRLENEFEDMGARLLQEAASKTNDVAGDGTTTATLLAYTLLEKGRQLVGGGVVDNVITTRINPMYLREELIKYSHKIVDAIKKQAVFIDDYDSYKRVATVSSQDEKIGTLVADAIKKVGKNGVIMVEESNVFHDSLEIKEGMEFENGFLSPYFVTDVNRMIAEIKDCYVLITDMAIRDPFDLVPIVEKIKNDGSKGLLIIADDVVGSALQTLVQTKLRLNFPVCAVVAPEFADRRRHMLEDLAILTGGEALFHDSGTLLKDVKLSQLGRANRVQVTQTHTIISPDQANLDSKELADRVDAIRALIKEEKNEFKKSKLEYRLSKLANGMAVIYAGGASASEVVERRERIIDAVHATRAALEEGIIAGGGVALYSVIESLYSDLKEPITDVDSLIYNMVADTLEKPFKQLLENSGLDVDKFDLDSEEPTVGVNVLTGEYVDMLDAGIVDPVKVTRLAVIHAFSVAAMLLTTDTAITEPREEVKK